MSVYPHEPFLDFKFGDHYASDYGLVRTSNGSRYNNNLLPTLTEKNAEIPGGDGTYYFNTFYKQRQFTIDFAYDSLTETNLRALRNWLNGKEIHDLIFAEWPDRAYKAKVTGAPSLKFIPFDEVIDRPQSHNVMPKSKGGSDQTQVIYKGEGSVQFTCYDPYAYSLISYDESTTPGGDVNPTFETYMTGSTRSIVCPVGSVFSVTSDTRTYTITLQEAAHDIKWNSSTGMVTGIPENSNTRRALKFSGQSVGILTIGVPITISSNPPFTLNYYNKYY